MARPFAGVASHGLATCKGAVGYSQGPLQRGDRLRPRSPARGQLDSAKATPATSDRQWPTHEGRLQWPGLSARALAACAWAATAAQKGQEGLGQSICEKDDRTLLNLENFEDCPCV
ncbi:hypothetical protein B296_00013592 [Ensete ventricosum]|uniref:Uncharacterized protein n=1 Tax=Ensete ventricosum TaxID=4639 RepID=A0A426YWV4_ENSVE|nr:hypothetical protein B296_00013592 [Ensete ventricosum]